MRDINKLTNFRTNQIIRPNGPTTEIFLEEPGYLQGRMENGDWKTIDYGTHFKVTTNAEELRCSSSGSHDVVEVQNAARVDEAPFTNINKIPGQSAEQRAVTLALRTMKSERDKMRREMAEISRQQQLEAGHEDPAPELEPPEIIPEEPEDQEATPAEEVPAS
jgi:hypothetical protein